MSFRCYVCGFETEDRSDFISTNCTSTHHWMDMFCPQCSTRRPPVCEVTPRGGPQPLYRQARWTLAETADGLRVRAYPLDGVRGSILVIPVHENHIVLDKSARFLNPSYTGTLRDLARRLEEDARERNAAFSTELKALGQERDEKSAHATREQREALRLEYQGNVDEARERHQIGPCWTDIEYETTEIFQGN